MKPNRSMTTVSSDRTAGHSRRFPLTLALLGLVLVGLTQTGCRSNGCSNCNIGSKLSNGFQNVRERVFNRRLSGGNCSTCGTMGNYEEGTVIDSGIPIIAPGGTAIPAPAALAPAPVIESDPQLAPLPPAGGSSAGGSASNRNPSGTNRSAYEATRPRNDQLASKRGTDLTRAYQPATPTPAVYSTEEPDILDHLPPVDLPPDLSSRVKPVETPQSPDPAAVPALKTGSEVNDALTLPSDDAKPSTTSVESNSTEDRRVLGLRRKPINPPTRVVPGMAKSASVAPQIAGGSLPSADGLAWLKEKGYRTLIDLRPQNEVEPGYADHVIDQGITYVPLPFSTAPISQSRLTRFNELLGQNEQKPIYFCDGDGRRAGLIWYLRLRSLDREETTSARAKAEEIGLVVGDLTEADRFLQANYAHCMEVVEPRLEIQVSWGAVEPTSQKLTKYDRQPTLTSLGSNSLAVQSAPRSEVVSAPRKSGSAPLIPKHRNLSSTHEPSWKPVAALVLSGLGVPLAYWSRTTLLQKRIPRRASLTVKELGPRKALPSSDV